MPVGYAKSIDQVPKGAIIIASPEEAYERHRTLIRAWKPQRDVFALKYGGLFISAAATTTAVFMFTPLRRSLKLQGYNASSIFLAGLLPAPNVIYYQFEKLIETPLVIADKYMCPACICTRALALQFAVGICLPTVSMAVLNYIAAYGYGTMKLPYYRNYKETASTLWRLLFKPNISRLINLSAFQAIVVFCVFTAEIESLKNMEYAIAKKSFEREQELLRKRLGEEENI